MVRTVVMAVDALVLAACFGVACSARSVLAHEALGPLVARHLWLLWVVLPTWLLALQAAGLYESLRYVSYRWLLRRLGAAHLAASVTLLSLLYLSHSWEVSRLLVQGFVGIAFVALALEKIGLRVSQRWVRRRGRNTRNVVVVGCNGLAARYIEGLRAHPFWGLRLLGFVAERPGVAPPPGAPAPLLGTLAELPAILVEHPVDEVAFAVPGGPSPALGVALAACAEKGVTARMVLELPPGARRTPSVELLGELPVVSYETTPAPGLAVLAKRAIDVAGALAGMLAFAVTYVVYGRWIRRASGGSVLFRQTRIGQNGRPFVLYKFRTMRTGDDGSNTELADRNAMRGPIFKLRDDPRVTPIGQRLRRRHLDELPQFWNVLRGDMSLVGTRPPTPDEVRRYDLRHHARLAWKPGLTGMWQVAGHEAVADFDEVVRLDREYVERWSLGLDMRILARTVRKVWGGEGW